MESKKMYYCSCTLPLNAVTLCDEKLSALANFYLRQFQFEVLLSGRENKIKEFSFKDKINILEAVSADRKQVNILLSQSLH